MRRIGGLFAASALVFAGVAAAQVTYGNRPPPPPPGYGQQTISCGSPQFRHALCQVDVGARGRVALQRQSSDARCVEGRTWGWNRAGIWVDKGCGGQFMVTRRW